MHKRTVEDDNKVSSIRPVIIDGVVACDATRSELRSLAKWPEALEAVMRGKTVLLRDGVPVGCY